MLRTSMPKKPTAIILILVLSIALQLTTLLAIRPQKESGLDYQNIIHNSREFTPKKEYDYIVVGGGTAGCPLAATLSEKHSVLLLERGGTSDENPYVLRQENMLLTLLLADNNNSAAETFVSEDGLRNARARILGGGTLVNFAFYSRANPEFYEKSGIEWDMDVVNESYEWVEETIVFRADKLSDWASSFRDSLLEAGVTPNNGYTLDHKVGTKQSGTIFDSNGIRHGADELLKKANSNNLDVVIHATVDRIIFSNSPVLSAVGIIYRDSNGNSHEVRVHGNGEVILSTGALGTPQLLLLSGVGPNSYLSSLDIPVVQDQPFVGEFMCDNPRNSFYLDNPFPAASAGNPIVGITKDATYIESISGTLPFFSPFGFALFHNTSIPSLNVSMVGIVSKFSQPLSKGWLKLASATNASTNPIVRFNYFARQEDLSQCVNGMHVYENMLKTNALEKYMFQDLFQGKHFKFLGTPFPIGQGDDALETFCHDSLMTFYHYHGGCLVDKVVDNQLKVKGIKALRIVDGSILTLSPGTNPQATLMMLGRYIGLKIQEERRKGNVFDERPFGIFRSSFRISSVV